MNTIGFIDCDKRIVTRDERNGLISGKEDKIRKIVVRLIVEEIIYDK